MSFDLMPADEIELKECVYHWNERIPEGQIVVVAGRPGGGKSTVICDIVSSYTTEGHHVILSNQEDSASSLRARLEAAGADLKKVRISDSESGTSYRFPDDVGTLALHIMATGARIAIFDTSAQHLVPSLSNDQAVRSALSPLAKLAEQTGCTMLFVDHVTKHVSKNAYPLTALRGNGMAGAARMAFFVGVNPENSGERACVWVKDQYRELPKALTFEAEPYTVTDEDGKVELATVRLILTNAEAEIDPMALLAGKASEDAAHGPGTDKRAMAAEWLTIYLSGGKRPAKELRDDAAKCGISWASIRRGADDIGIEKYREGFGPGSKLFWALPDGHPALVSDDEVNEIDGEIAEDAEGVEVLSEADEATLTDDDIALLLGGSTENETVETFGDVFRNILGR